MPEQIESAKLLSEKLAEILVKWPLYRVYTYAGTACHGTETGAYKQERYGLLPKQIRMFCSHSECGYETLWEISDNKLYFEKVFYQAKELRLPKLRRHHRTLLLYLAGTKNG